MTLAHTVSVLIFENQFDAMNRRTQVTAKVGETVELENMYVYDALGRTTGITQGEKQVEYSYNAAGQRISTSVFSGVDKVFDTLYSYDGAGRLTNLTHQNDEKVFASYDYSWDLANRITAMNDAEYGYDKTSQLVSAEYDALPKELYEYDANGNRKNFQTGKNNQLLSDGIYDYEYDAEGNRTAKKSKSGEVTQYEWDHRNRLVKVVTPKETVSYVYDYMNRLTCRNDEFIVHDGWQIVMTLNKNGGVKDKNLWGANQDELLCENDTWTLSDHLGTVRDLIDSEDVLRNHLQYNAFGKLVSATDAKNLPRFRYTGKLFDAATGLQWNINRWYDAEVGRWISEDPIGYKSDNENLFRYVHNDSIKQVDPSGLITAPGPPDAGRQKECCDKVKKDEFTDKGIPAPGGTVICCDKHNVSCVWGYEPKDDIPLTYGQSAINNCAREHEDDHKDNDMRDCTCDGAYLNCIKPELGEEGRDNAECRAYRVEIACLRKALGNSDSGLTDDDEELINKRISKLIEGGNSKYSCSNHGGELT